MTCQQSQCYCCIMQVANKVASRCVEMAAGVGFTKEYPLEKYYRDSKIGELIHIVVALCTSGATFTRIIVLLGQIYEGTSFTQLNTIARCMDDEFKRQ